MATVNMRYDHPQYVVNVGASGVIQAQGAAGTKHTSVVYGAYVDTLLKAVHTCPLVGGTNTAATANGDLLGVHVRNGTAVTGGTTTLVAAGDYGTGLTGTSVLVTTTLSRGDTYRVYGTGTDQTTQLAICIEGRALPGGSVTS